MDVGRAARLRVALCQPSCATLAESCSSGTSIQYTRWSDSSQYPLEILWSYGNFHDNALGNTMHVSVFGRHVAVPIRFGKIAFNSPLEMSEIPPSFQ